MSRFEECLDLCVTSLYYGFRVACYAVMGLLLIFLLFVFAMILFWRPDHGVDNNRLRSLNNVKQIGLGLLTMSSRTGRSHLFIRPTRREAAAKLARAHSALYRTSRPLQRIPAR